MIEMTETPEAPTQSAAEAEILKTTTSQSPTRVEPLNAHEMYLEWSGGSKFSLPYFELRFACPCASCINENTGKRMIRREDLDPAVRCVGVRPVGRYALQMGFSDRHDTGLFHFDRLWHLCKSAGKEIGKTQT